MNRAFRFVLIAGLGIPLLCLSCASSAGKGNAAQAQPKTPAWVQSLEAVYPSTEWVAVTASGENQQAAELAAMNALARAFKTNVAGITEASQRMSQLVSDAAGKKSVAFDQSQHFSQEVNTTTNIKGLFGVQVDRFQVPSSTVYVCARMNRRECAARYSGMIRENASVIDLLLARVAGMPLGFEQYAALGFAHSVALVTDNFQNILEVLDSAASSRRPAYGGASAIKVKMQACASGITVGIAVQTENRQDVTLLIRALGSFFKDLGFPVNERGSGLYTLNMNLRFEFLAFNQQMQVYSYRYYMDAALEGKNGNALFSFTKDERKNHLMESEARRLALQAAETSIKEGAFAQDFDKWLNSLVE